MLKPKYSADFNEAGHIYRIPGTDKQIPSSTTIMGSLAVINKKDPEAKPKQLINMDHMKPIYAQRGTQRHDYNFLRLQGHKPDDLNTEDMLDEDLEICENQLTYWMDKEAVILEVPMYSVDPFFAGTPDAIFKIDGLYYLNDWKNWFNEYYWYQISSYKYLLHVNYDIPLKNIRPRITDRSGHVHKLEDNEWEEYFHTFKEFVNVYNTIKVKGH